MLVETKSARGIDTVPIETKLFANRNIYITGEINTSLITDVSKQILYLLESDAKKSIKIWINSEGGSIQDGLYLYDMLCGIKNTPIYMIATGKCYSMAALLFLAGQKGRRLIFENTELMLHEPLIDSRIGGSSSKIKSVSDSLLEAKKRINIIISKHTGMSLKAVEKETSYDHFYNSKEALEKGLADKIVDYAEIIGGKYNE